MKGLSPARRYAKDASVAEATMLIRADAAEQARINASIRTAQWSARRLILGRSIIPPAVLLLYGSLRSVSYSRAATEEAARLLRFYPRATRENTPAVSCTNPARAC